MSSIVLLFAFRKIHIVDVYKKSGVRFVYKQPSDNHLSTASVLDISTAEPSPFASLCLANNSLAAHISTSIESILRDLDLPPTSSKIYQDLLENGEATVRLLSDLLYLTRPSTYDLLAIPKLRGLIIERKIDN